MSVGPLPNPRTTLARLTQLTLQPLAHPLDDFALAGVVTERLGTA